MTRSASKDRRNLPSISYMGSNDVLIQIDNFLELLELKHNERLNEVQQTFSEQK